ncbi:uncharacterized protein LOC133847409 [Drosophila sulfurigaster albostrigata]|uniref:uncharacterized protein LOC133847409 n=1 Tax=Drosophila sulfurigaster albostrigata TaxID=89887 RepID=UPI002D21C640|nr:uncharacterized protein LOC133847409 [Drosophila sulfurigaster albostrigata]
MNRHENIVCKGCGKMDFTGRCYRCLSCQDFNMCAECYDHDFTTTQHLFDHPVKCVLTPADVELYFGGEYLNDPPQSYRCPYCKQWGYNESTFLEHVSAEHMNASTLLVSTMVTLFEQQQAVRLFLEDEQLAVFASAATSRNELMNRNEGSLELYLEPLNPNGSYQRDHVNGTYAFRVVKPGAVEVAPWVADSGVALSSSNANHNVDNNFLIPDPVRRQSLLERTRNRLNLDRSPLTLQQLQQQHQEQDQQQLQQMQQQQHELHQQQHQLRSAHPTLSEMMRFNEPLPTSRPNRNVPMQSPNQTPSGRSINLFGAHTAGETMRRSIFSPVDLTRPRSQRHRNQRMQMDGFATSGSGLRQVHVQRLRGGPGAPTANQRLVEFSELAHNTAELMMASGPMLLRTIEEEEQQQVQQPIVEVKKVDQERERFLCFPFLSDTSMTLCPPEERVTFLAKRAEFVAQLLASVLCEEELSTGIATPIKAMTETTTITTHKLRNRLASEFVGAGDSELDLKHTTSC